MRLKHIELSGFKSFAKKTTLDFSSSVTAVVGPNGSGKSNVVESIRFVLGEQSMKSMRGKGGVDLIFKGSKTLPKASRAMVSIYFDNKDKVFKLENENGEKVNLNYDTIQISREVFSDGLNKYSLNGSEVRLKDIINLLSSVNIGSSGHHIISQGEADRILNASSRERREMIEDALGLKIYQYKIKDAERKLERTSTNMKEVSLLRKEIAPHLGFLKKQVEKLEKAKELKIELKDLYREYLKKESIFLSDEKDKFSKEKEKIREELKNISEKIALLETRHEEKNNNPKIGDISLLESKINEIRNKRGEIDRKLGRIEGVLEIEENRLRNIPKEEKHENIIVPYEDAKKFAEEMNDYIENALKEREIPEILKLLEKIKETLNSFSPINFKNGNTNFEAINNQNVQNLEKEIDSLRNTKTEIMIELENLKNEEQELSSRISEIKHEIENENRDFEESQKNKWNLTIEKERLNSLLGTFSYKEEQLSKSESLFEDEIREGSVFVGSEILSYKNFELQNNDEPREIQEERRRKIERIKIKLEDAGLGGAGEVFKEFEEVSTRDEFLAKEMVDLSSSIESLRRLMIDLKEKIDIEFKEGVVKINKEFQEFFSIMFGGGAAFLTVVAQQKKGKGDEENENEDGIIFEHGIEISVSLPHKKVRELHALSGGERSLASIALLFAISQVNPPPFLVLDETDAALDEANSRKYGDMIERLSKHSELVVVTHNRETMSRAGVLYGVTVGADGASKLLSIKFEEAAAIAK